MDGDDVVKDLIITEVKFTKRELGQGAYGRVFAVNYNGITCAAKMYVERGLYFKFMHLISPRRGKTRNDFLQECVQHSKLHHPNIVKMLGVYYPSDQDDLPVLVMELMECNLEQLLKKYQNIPMYVKLSILQDVSKAICYLHTLNPPIMHRNLFPTNILLTTSLVAKVCDLKVALSGNMTLSRTLDFMPPEASSFIHPHYGPPSDVFSFGCVVCHVITQEWPERLKHKESVTVATPLYGHPEPLSEVQKRNHYIYQIREGSLQQLVITCLDNDPERRPPISLVSERITSIITG